jgi:hypothetical protein
VPSSPTGVWEDAGVSIHISLFVLASRLDGLSIYGHMHACIHTYIHACIHTYYIHTYIHAYPLSFIHACIHAYIHACVHAYIHACIQTFMIRVIEEKDSISSTAYRSIA